LKISLSVLQSTSWDSECLEARDGMNKGLEKKPKVVAMQILAACAIPPKEAVEYICSLPNLESILLDPPSQSNINETVSFIHQFDQKHQQENSI
jgi:hypothetical protein